MSGKLTSYGLTAVQIAEKSGFLAGGSGCGAGGSGGGPQGLCGERGTCGPRDAGTQSTAVTAVLGESDLRRLPQAGVGHTPGKAPTPQAHSIPGSPPPLQTTIC